MTTEGNAPVNHFDRPDWLDDWDRFTPTLTELTLPLLVDAHVHVRQGEAMKVIAPYHAGFEAIVVEPNTAPPVTTGEQARAYTHAVSELVPGTTVLPTIYLTKDTTHKVIYDAYEASVRIAKYYPPVTTNSEHGVANLKDLYPALNAMRDCGMILQLHAESAVRTDHVLNAEDNFLPTLCQLVDDVDGLKISVEHVTSGAMAQTVIDLPERVVMSITLHHLFLVFQDVVGSKLHPHNFCKPVAKMWDDRSLLITCATSPDPKFRKKAFFGSDSAPHEEATKKHCDACCAGVFSAPVIPELLVELFEKLGALEQLQAFAVRGACAFYGHKHSGRTMKLVREAHTVPMLHGPYRSFWAGKQLAWKRAT